MRATGKTSGVHQRLLENPWLSPRAEVCQHSSSRSGEDWYDVMTQFQGRGKPQLLFIHPGESQDANNGDGQISLRMTSAPARSSAPMLSSSLHEARGGDDATGGWPGAPPTSAPFPPWTSVEGRGGWECVHCGGRNEIPSIFASHRCRQRGSSREEPARRSPWESAGTLSGKWRLRVPGEGADRSAAVAAIAPGPLPLQGDHVPGSPWRAVGSKRVTPRISHASRRRPRRRSTRSQPSLTFALVGEEVWPPRPQQPVEGAASRENGTSAQRAAPFGGDPQQAFASSFRDGFGEVTASVAGSLAKLRSASSRRSPALHVPLLDTTSNADSEAPGPSGVPVGAAMPMDSQVGHRAEHDKLVDAIGKAKRKRRSGDDELELDDELQRFTQMPHARRSQLPREVKPGHSEVMRPFLIEEESDTQDQRKSAVETGERSHQSHPRVPHHDVMDTEDDWLTRTSEMLESSSIASTMKISGSIHARHPAGHRKKSLGNVCLGLAQKGERSISYRLNEKKRLNKLSRAVINMQFYLAILGIALMVIDNELFFVRVIEYHSTTSIVLRSFNTVSTLFLLGSILWYSIIDVQIRMVDSGVCHWRLTVNNYLAMRVLVGWAVCIIHPPPLGLDFITKGKNSSNWDADYLSRSNSSKGEWQLYSHSIDAFLSVFMMCRIYIVISFVVVHSRLLRSTIYQSIGAMNNVKVNWLFVFKAYMNDRPGTILISIMAVIYLANVWAMHTCEAYVSKYNRGSALEEVSWLVAITFLTVGYGDVTPKSHCGRVISVTTGLLGVGTTALLVAVLASKLEQSRAERYVHNFLTRTINDKRRCKAAANVIKSVFLLWRLQNSSEGHYTKRFHLQRLLMKSMQEMRCTKNANVMIGESAIGILEVFKVISDMQFSVDDIRDNQTIVCDEIDKVQGMMVHLSRCMDTLITSLQHRVSAVNIPEDRVQLPERSSPSRVKASSSRRKTSPDSVEGGSEPDRS